jgi:hypothetical protein
MKAGGWEPGGDTGPGTTEDLSVNTCKDSPLGTCRNFVAGVERWGQLCCWTWTRKFHIRNGARSQDSRCGQVRAPEAGEPAEAGVAGRACSPPVVVHNGWQNGWGLAESLSRKAPHLWPESDGHFSERSAPFSLWGGWGEPTLPSSPSFHCSHPKRTASLCCPWLGIRSAESLLCPASGYGCGWRAGLGGEGEGKEGTGPESESLPREPMGGGWGSGTHNGHSVQPLGGPFQKPNQSRTGCGSFYLSCHTTSQEQQCSSAR